MEAGAEAEVEASAEGTGGGPLGGAAAHAGRTIHMGGDAGNKAGETDECMRCPFEGFGCHFPKALCPHAHRCMTCDEWSCSECRLTRGDGEDVVRRGVIILFSV